MDMEEAAKAVVAMAAARAEVAKAEVVKGSPHLGRDVVGRAHLRAGELLVRLQHLARGEGWGEGEG